jgi:threonine dehydratase
LQHRKPDVAKKDLTPDVEGARAAMGDVVRRTPVLSSRTLSELCGATVVLKAENLQRTGSFKLRGALAKLAALGPRCAAGVVTGSAGNHGQALAYAARVRGVRCEVFMPASAPIAKVEAASALGAEVRMAGEHVIDALMAAEERAREAGMHLVHPFEDPDVIAGQGTIGVELLEDVEDLAAVVVPIGGGGLASGIGLAVKERRPQVKLFGVQAEACAPVPASLRTGQPVLAERVLTIADGIAVKQPGVLTLELLHRYLDDVVVVPEDEIAEAMVFLLERAKLVVEGAGAVGVAALLDGRVGCAQRGTTVALLSGGNVDPGLLASVARRHETEAGRRLVLLTRVDDRPGALARLLAVVAEHGANLVEVSHVREGLDLHVRETAIELVLETRSRDHAGECVSAVAQAGYEVRVLR